MVPNKIWDSNMQISAKNQYIFSIHGKKSEKTSEIIPISFIFASWTCKNVKDDKSYSSTTSQ